MHLDCRTPSEISTTIDELVGDEVASRLMAQDATLWGPAAESEAAKRLAWVDLASTSRPLLAEIEALSAALREEGLTRLVLAGMGGSSLAPEVICATEGVSLITLDTTDPGQIATAFDVDLSRTVVVVSSKSGSTVETDSHRRYAEQRFREAGIDPATRMIVVTDPGSQLQRSAEIAGYRKVFLADPNVGGRYSALSAFGLVPAGLAGADISALLDDAADAAVVLARDSAHNPGLRLGALLGAAERAGAEKVVLAPAGTATVGFADWAEQLIAESTGKQGRGILPIAVEGPAAPGYLDAGPDAVKVALGPGAAPQGGSAYSVATDGPLGAQLLMWEVAVAIACRVIGVNPFDQPNVEEAKRMARELLGEATVAQQGDAVYEDDVLAVYCVHGRLCRADTVPQLVDAALGSLRPGDYLAIMAYLDRLGDADAAALRAAVARRTEAQVTFGWGPRFLHSTGQYHKGGHQNGTFWQVTAESERDAAIPGQQYTFAGLQRAQASGDARVLADNGRTVLRIHLKDRSTGIAVLLRALKGS